MSTTNPNIAIDDSDRNNPFPGADQRAWTDRFSAALAEYTGIPREVTDQFAPFVVRTKTYLTRSGGEGYRLRTDTITTNAFGQQILTVKVHGFAGDAPEHNERIRSFFDAPFRPGADANKVLPALATGTGPKGFAPYLTTKAPVSTEHMQYLLAVTDAALNYSDRDRGYDLADDIAIQGQDATTLHALLARTITQSDGTARTVVSLPAIKGANRSRARLSLFGLTSKDLVFGLIPEDALAVASGRRPSGSARRSVDRRVWVPALASLLRKAYDDPEHPGHAAARHAANVATVPLDLIVGTTIAPSFHISVFDPNRTDHRRPPLLYSQSNRAASDLRAVLRAYAAAELVEEPTRAWLAGEGPDPDPVAGESLVDARDRRDRSLADAVFPGDMERQDILREVLGEPRPSRTTKAHAQHRTLMLSAGVVAGYTVKWWNPDVKDADRRWNPRVLENLVTMTELRSKELLFSTRAWADDLMDLATGTPEDMATFFRTRGMHWLAEADLAKADRGSVGAQRADDDGDSAEEDPATESNRVRRGPTNVRDALAFAPARAAGLFRELAEAVNEHRAPRQVDAHGIPVPDTTATRTWFDREFPKPSRKRGGPIEDPEVTPEQPTSSPAQVALAARQEVFTAAESVVSGVSGLITALRALNDAARVSEEVPLDADDPLTRIIEEMMNVAWRDLNALRGTVSSMRFATITDDELPTGSSDLLAEGA